MGKKIKIGLISVLALAGVAVALYFMLYEDYPYYKKMERLRVTNFTKDNITVTGDVICHNPNSVEVRLAGADFKVQANGKHVSDVHQTIGSTIPADSDFKVPIKVSFSPKKIFKLKDLLGVAFTSLKSKALHMRYDGVVHVGLLGEDIEIPVEYEDDISFK